MNLDEHKLKLEYPLNWQYKLIGKSDTNILLAIEEICKDRDYKHKMANKSSGGKFLSFYVDVLVHNDDDRASLFDSFANHQHINYVI